LFLAVGCYTLFDTLLLQQIPWTLRFSLFFGFALTTTTTIVLRNYRLKVTTLVQKNAQIPRKITESKHSTQLPVGNVC